MKIIILDEEAGTIGVDGECDDDVLLCALEEKPISKIKLIVLFADINASFEHSDAGKLAKLVPLIKTDITRFSKERSFERPKKKIMPEKNRKLSFERICWSSRKR